MSDNIPPQSDFLYENNWSHGIDVVFLDTLITLKHAAGCEGNVFPSHFFFEAKLSIIAQLGHSFEWYELVYRLHFLERRFKTFNEIVKLEGTYWHAPTNVVIVVAPNWKEALERNPLLGAYHQRGDPAYNQLCDLFASNDMKEEREKTVIVLSETIQNEGQVAADPDINDTTADFGEVNSNPRDSFGKRNLMFDEGGLLDCESTNKSANATTNPTQMVSLNGKLRKKGHVYCLKCCHPRAQTWPTPVHQIAPGLCGGCRGSPRYERCDGLLPNFDKFT